VKVRKNFRVAAVGVKNAGMMMIGGGVGEMTWMPNRWVGPQPDKYRKALLVLVIRSQQEPAFPSNDGVIM